MLWYLSQCKKSSFSDSIAQLLAKFKHTGPNGIHTCLVFEPMGPSVSSVVEDLEAFQKYRPGVRVRYPVWIAKRILNQVLCGLVFLHHIGVSHGDLQPGSMLFTLKDLGDLDGDKLKQDEKYKWGSISPPGERKVGKVNKWAPKYLAVPQPLDKFADIDKDFRLKLSDMGAGGSSISILESPLRKTC
jgi:serine/threonine protein kinase